MPPGVGPLHTNSDGLLISDGSSSVWQNIPTISEVDELTDRVDSIENLLGIPTRDKQLELKYPKLEEIWEEYKDNFKDQMRTLRQLSDSYNDEKQKYENWEKVKK
jgi:hypothetical protein